MPADFHTLYLDLVDGIERDFKVAQWRWRDVDLWPLARMDLYMDMNAQALAVPQPRARKTGFPALAYFARPLINLWKSRHDLRHHVLRPKPAHAILLGDGVSLDRIDGAWQDRFGEPIIAALERRGLDTYIMQAGSLARLPWRRPTFAANRIERLGVWRGGQICEPAVLPDHDQVLQRLSQSGVYSPSLSLEALARRASILSATATGFERVLRSVRPKLAFVVTWYAGLGPAYVLACRRQGVVSVDLQHCPQERAHKAYRWTHVPEGGYTMLPAIFWNWTTDDAAAIAEWADGRPWHRGFHGGHTQIDSVLTPSETKRWDMAFEAIGDGMVYDREILIALQPIPGYGDVWDALAAEIEKSPPTTRWWVRRHPASHRGQDEAFRRLLSLRRPNVEIERASDFPLPALLRHMNVVLSLASGAAVEGAMFGVPAIFLSESARGPFGGLIARGGARIVGISDLLKNIACLPLPEGRQILPSGPAIEDSIARLEDMAAHYSAMCRDPSTGQRS